VVVDAVSGVHSPHLVQMDREKRSKRPYDEGLES
jgi:hypothetical protein